MGKLTAVQVRNLVKPGRYSDGQGLILDVKASGAKSWTLRVQRDGRRMDVGLGSYPATSLQDAREKALETRKQVRAGIDPIEAKRASKRLLAAIPTFEEAANRVHETRKAGWRNGKHQAQWLSSLRTYAFPVIGRLAVDKVTVAEMSAVLTPIWLSKPETAQRVFQRMGTVLDWAAAQGYRPSEAPLRAVRAGLPKRPRSQNHFAALPHEQIAALMSVLTATETMGRLALRFLILTAARSGEVRGARWDEIDLSAATWTIPANRMKAGREHVIPLSGPAITILHAAEKLKRRACDPYVFPGTSGKPLSDMTLSKVLRSALPGNFTVHGFRSTFRDWAAELSGFSGEVAEAALAHTIPNRVEAAYRRTNYLDRRRLLMADWAAYASKASS